MRTISEEERAILRRLLSVDFDDVDALRVQAEAIGDVETNCTCGCPSITPLLDRASAPSARCSSPLPVELAEMNRSGGIPRTVLCFLDEEGYLANLECVYDDDALDEWPDPQNCAVLIHDEQRYLESVALPSGVIVHPKQPDDRWVSFETQADGGFCAGGWSGYRECFAADGTEVSRVFTK